MKKNRYFGRFALTLLAACLLHDVQIPPVQTINHNNINKIQ